MAHHTKFHAMMTKVGHNILITQA